MTCCQILTHLLARAKTSSQAPIRTTKPSVETYTLSIEGVTTEAKAYDEKQLKRTPVGSAALIIRIFREEIIFERFIFSSKIRLLSPTFRKN